jgi:CheY-like chemotaxis protein
LDFSVKILVAEDEPVIAAQYRVALESRSHDVAIKNDGQSCLDAYRAALKARDAVPFDAVILDYRMPNKNGLEVAKEMLALRPKQRIIFASAYVVETLTESVKQLGQVVELLQKPFEVDVLADMVEDRGIYEELEKINVRVRELKNLNANHRQLVDLLVGLKKLQKDIRGL